MDIAIWIAIAVAIAAAIAAALAAHYTHKALRAEPTVTVDARDAALDDYRPRFCAWLREQGFDPETVERVDLRGRTAWVTEHVLDADGDLMLNRRRDAMMTTTRTVAVAVPPPLAAPGLDLTRRWTDGTPAD